MKVVSLQVFFKDGAEAESQIADLVSTIESDPAAEFVGRQVIQLRQGHVRKTDIWGRAKRFAAVREKQPIHCAVPPAGFKKNVEPFRPAAEIWHQQKQFLHRVTQNVRRS